MCSTVACAAALLNLIILALVILFVMLVLLFDLIFVLSLVLILGLFLSLCSFFSFFFLLLRCRLLLEFVRNGGHSVLCPLLSRLRPP